jgi:hypothetical protein
LRKKIANYVKKVVKIQAWWRGYLQRKNYARLLESRIKSRAAEACRFAKVKAKYQLTMDYYREHVRMLHIISYY